MQVVDEYLLDPVVDRVERNDRLGCFVDRLYQLVEDFTTRLDLADFRSTWSTCGHVDQSFLLVLAYCMATDAKKFCVQSPDAFPVPSGRPSFPFPFSPPNIFIVGSRDYKMRSMRHYAFTAPCSCEQVTMWREHLHLNAISRLLIDRLN